MPRKFVRPFLPPMSALLILSACGTPQQQCITSSTAEYRVVSELLDEVEGNLARGYAWEERPVASLSWGTCGSLGRGPYYDGWGVSGACMTNVIDTERVRVPIDPLTETRKRDGLIARRAALTPAAEAAVRACGAAHPGG